MSNKDFELNHLKYFYYTVLEGGVAQAADRLCVQQPVVSKMLKNLEEDLGKPLFWKNGRSKSLTDYGQLIYRHSQVVFGEINQIKQVSKEPKEITGVFNVGGAEPIVNYLYSKTFSHLIGVYPKINFNVYTSTQIQLLNMISEGKLDLGCFFYTPNLAQDLKVFKSIPFKFSLVIKTSKKSDKNVLQSFIGSREVDDLSTHSFPTVELLRKKYPDTRITFSSNSISLHKQLVLKGLGVSIMPSFMVEKEINKGQLTELYPSKKFEWDLMVVAKKSEYLGDVAEQFIKNLGL